MNTDNKNKPFSLRFAAAFNGLRVALRSENSFRTQLVFAILVLLALLILQPGWLWSGLLILCICLVLAAELLNTAIEHLCDFVEPQFSEKIKTIKDLAAAAVLVCSSGAVLVACLLLLSYLSQSTPILGG